MGVPVTEFERIGTAIKWLRTHAGLTQAELGRRAKVTKGLISKYELGDAKPTLDTLGKLIRALGIDARELVETLEEVEESEGGRDQPGVGREAALAEVNRDLQRLARSFDQLVKAKGQGDGASGPDAINEKSAPSGDRPRRQ